METIVDPSKTIELGAHKAWVEDGSINAKNSLYKRFVCISPTGKITHSGLSKTPPT